jgi:hypothetical protein
MDYVYAVFCRTRNLMDQFAEAGYFSIAPKLLVPPLEGGTEGEGKESTSLTILSNCILICEQFLQGFHQILIWTTAVKISLHIFLSSNGVSV